MCCSPSNPSKSIVGPFAAGAAFGCAFQNEHETTSRRLQPRPTHHAASVRTPLARMLPRVMGGLSSKIVGSQHHGSVGLGLLLEELTRCSLFNYFAQPHKLIHALIWFYAAPTFKMVHRRGANRAQNYFSLIEHRELNDRPRCGTVKSLRNGAFAMPLQQGDVQ